MAKKYSPPRGASGSQVEQRNRPVKNRKRNNKTANKSGGPAGRVIKISPFGLPYINPGMYDDIFGGGGSGGGGGVVGNPKPSPVRPGGRGSGRGPGVRPGGGRPDRPGRGPGASPGATPLKPDKDKGTGGRPGRGGGGGRGSGGGGGGGGGGRPGQRSMTIGSKKKKNYR